MKISVYKYVLLDEDGIPLRKFVSRLEAQKYVTDGMTLVKLPKQPSAYHMALLLCGEALL